MSELGEQDIKNLAIQHRELSQRAEAMQQQLNMVHMSLDDCMRAISTLGELGSLDGEKSTMIPIGSGSFVHADLKKLDQIVVNVGAGISVEKSIDDATQILNTRKDELSKVIEGLNDSLMKVRQHIQSIESLASAQNK